MAEKEYQFSASRLKLIDDCFGKYYYRYVQKVEIPQIIWPGTIRGTILHKLLEESVNLKIKGESNEAILSWVKGRFKLYFDELKEDTTKGKFKASRNYKYDLFVEQGEKAAVNFVRFVINFFHKDAVFYPELELESKYDFVPDVNLKGVLDLPFQINDILRITDFKTTKESNKWYFVLFREDIQKLCYFFLALKKFGKLPVGFDYLIYNIEEKNIFFNSITYVEPIEDIQTFFKPLTERIKLVKYLHDNPNIKYYNPSKEGCKWCEYKDICPRAIK